MLATLVALGIAICPQGTNQAPAKLDRSGEPMLREMLVQIAAIQRYHAIIFRSARGSGSQDFLPEGTVEIWRDRGKFRVEFFDMWGTTNIVVCDGKKVMDDRGFDPVVLKHPGKLWVEASGSLDVRGSAGSPWFLLTEGPSLLDRFGKDRRIVIDDSSGAVVWDTREYGKLTLRRPNTQSGTTIIEVDYDNLPWQEEMHKMAPEWFEAPDPTAITRHRIVVLQDRFPRDVFDLKPGKGRIVEDQTQTAKKPPRLY